MGWPMPGKSAGLIGRTHGVRAEILASVNGSAFVVPLPLAGPSAGSVPVDGKSNARRKLSCQVIADVDSPSVSPITAEVQAWYVLIDDPSGEEFRIPVGTFVVGESKESSPGVVDLNGTDRWSRVQEARFPSPVQTSGNTVDAITNLLMDADSRIEVVVDPGTGTGSHRASVWERDRDTAVVKLAQSIGATVYFDPLGVAHIGPLPGLSRDPYWNVTVGRGGVRLGRSRGISREKTYNGVSVTADPGNGVAPVFGAAYDLVPGSSTRWGGPFGKRTRFYSSSLISTSAQANATAASMLTSVLGVTRTMSVQTLAHPGLDAMDVIEVEVTEGVYRRYLAGAFTLPLGLGALSIDALTSADQDDGGQ